MAYQDRYANGTCAKTRSAMIILYLVMDEKTRGDGFGMTNGSKAFTPTAR